MRARLPHPIERTRSRHAARRGRARQRSREETPRRGAAEDASPTPESRMRQGGGPEDQGFYACDCGYAFEAQVSTSVRCPHCGDQQAW